MKPRLVLISAEAVDAGSVRLTWEYDGGKVDAIYLVEVVGISMRLRELRGWNRSVDVLDDGPKPDVRSVRVSRVPSHH
jgi:hypothetical protein